MVGGFYMLATRHFGFWVWPREWWQHRRSFLGIQIWHWHIHAWCWGFRIFPVGNYQKKFRLYELLFWRPMTASECDRWNRDRVLAGYVSPDEQELLLRRVGLANPNSRRNMRDTQGGSKH
jgi:hypothetical protein